MTRVVLASASPGRLKVLRQAGIDPLVIVSGVDEDATLAALGPATPAQVTTALATAKAERVARTVEAPLVQDCVVIGCDSMLLFDGRLRGKPGSVDAAREQWRAMAGASGELHTGHCVIRLRDGDSPRQLAVATAATVRFATPSEPDLEAYLAGGEPLSVAGGFTIDGVGGWFVDGIDGEPSAVIGLGLSTVRRLVAGVGLGIAELLAANPV